MNTKKQRWLLPTQHKRLKDQNGKLDEYQILKMQPNLYAIIVADDRIPFFRNDDEKEWGREIKDGFFNVYYGSQPGRGINKKG